MNLETLGQAVEGWRTTGLFIEYGLKFIAIGTVPEGRKPASSSAWLLLILFIPVVGLPLYLLMGSPVMSRRRHRKQAEAMAHIADVHAGLPDFPARTHANADVRSIMRLNRRLTGMPAVDTKVLGFYSEYKESIAAMTRAVDEACTTVHCEIYILAWDDTTNEFFEALARAKQRGVEVRLLFDQVGSWKYPGYYKLGRRLNSIGIEWHLTMPLAPWRWRFRRPDLRNHRKLLVVDGKRAFMGSQNMIDSSYLQRKNLRIGRHWVDCMVEVSGPAAESLNMVFATDWYLEAGELLDVPAVHHPEVAHNLPDDSVVQLVPSGPGILTEPNLRMFVSLIHEAKEHIILCSPYFVPDESLLEAITTACYRGVRVDLLVNEQADQFIVGHSQSSYYTALLGAGVHIHRYPAPMVLHSKFMIFDGRIAAMGSSNMDMRSFGLNYEITMMVIQGELIATLTDLAVTYMEASKELTSEEWAKRPLSRRYVDNAMRLVSGLL